MKGFTGDREGTGTKEWSEHSVNVCFGCSHKCLYCYARHRALRFKRISSVEEWGIERINEKAVAKKYGKKSGIVMFPTTHDISQFYLDACLGTLTKLLKAGNQVLVVSKPHLDCIREICKHLKPFSAQLLFRFTIGSLDESVCRFWEPGAPVPEERVECLRYAFAEGFETSVSIEPMLEGKEATVRVFEGVSPYVTETVWIGKMNKARERVDLSKSDNRHAVGIVEECYQTDPEILALVASLEGSSKVRWKDSIKQVIAKNDTGTGGRIIR